MQQCPLLHPPPPPSPPLRKPTEAARPPLWGEGSKAAATEVTLYSIVLFVMVGCLLHSTQRQMALVANRASSFDGRCVCLGCHSHALTFNGVI